MFWFDQFRHGDPVDIAFQEKVIDCFVNSIYLFDDRIVVNFNYQEGGRPVSLEEVLSSFLDGNGAPDIERQIVRFGVLSLCRKAAAHFLHTVCTFAQIRGFSAQGLHSLLSFA